MATTKSNRRHPGVALGGFFIVLAILVLIMVLSGQYIPKLGLDLSGGQSITLTAENSTGSGTINADSLEQARTIIEQRVNSLGVGEASVTTSGDNQIIIESPNVNSTDLVEMVGTTAQLGFRKVYDVQYAYASANPEQATELPSVPADVSDRPTAPESELPTDQAAREALLADQLAWEPSDDDKSDFASYNCDDPFPDVWDQPLFTCLSDKVLGEDMIAAGVSQKYLLGPQLIEGERVSEAGAGIPQNQIQWVVTLRFDSLGGSLFAKATEHLATQTEPLNQFAIVLDHLVMSAPRVSSIIPDGSAEISGSFNQQSATQLSNVLKYGALPLAFELGNVDNVSPSLGGEQLGAGLIAGAVGLGLVILYCFFYYRGLGIVVVASLIVAAATTYLMIVLLGQSVGFALSLPGMAGVIVAIGVTADSFVIFFERVRDEAREGRSIRTAVETGWDKAKRTIVVADMVSILSAVILFILSIGAVKGFAFALGLSTLIDLALVFFFTKPVVSLLVQTDFFGQGRQGSGLEAAHLGLAETRRPMPRRRPVTTGKEA